MTGERRKALILRPDPTIVGGVTVHIEQLFASSLSKAWDLDTFVVGRPPGPEGVAAKVGRAFGSSWALGRTLWERKPSIVHVNTSLVPDALFRDAVYMAVAKQAGCRVVCQVHGGFTPEELVSRMFGRLPTGRAMLARMLGLADALVLLVPGEVPPLRALLPDARIDIIPNAVDETLYRRPPARRPGPPRLLFLGRVVESKGIFDLIDAVAMLTADGLDFEVRVVGAGDDAKAAQRRSETLGIADRVRWDGALYGNAKIAAWVDADLFVFPSKHPEGLPYTLLESMAAGTPMVTTRSGGIGDVVGEGDQGLVVAPGDVAAFADAVRTLLLDPVRAEAMGRRGRATVIERYALRQLGARFEAVYEAVGRRISLPPTRHSTPRTPPSSHI